MSPTSSLRLGIDLGGTKIEALVLGPDGSELWRKRVPTPKDDYETVLDALYALVIEAETALGASVSVGIGMPGSLSPSTGLVRNSNTVCLNRRPLHRDLTQRLEREVRFANDANCFALSEATDGAARDGHVVFGAILGTGTGGGVVIDRRVHTGKNAIGGEWGHNPLPWPRSDELPGPLCFCGKRGCLETYVSGTGLARDYAEHAPHALSAPEITEQAAQGAPLALAALDRYFDRLARALATLLNVLDPDVVVIGGGMSRLDAMYAELPRRLPAYVFSDHVATQVVRALHGDASGVRGAAWLWPS